MQGHASDTHNYSIHLAMACMQSCNPAVISCAAAGVDVPCTGDVFSGQQLPNISPVIHHYRGPPLVRGIIQADLVLAIGCVLFGMEHLLHSSLLPG